MPVIDTFIDRGACIVTIVADFAGSPAEIFSLYADARRLERVWGPPSHPAAFVDHTLAPGFRSTYYLRGPGGVRYPGWWVVRTVDEPYRFEFDEGFADGEFNAIPGTPVGHTEYTFGRIGSRTRVWIRTQYASLEELELAQQMVPLESAVESIDQIDRLLRAERAADLRAVRA